MSMRYTMLALSVLLAACGEASPEPCSSDVAPECVIRGEEGDACQSDAWCQDGTRCDMSAEDWRMWECVSDDEPKGSPPWAPPEEESVSDRDV